MNRYLASSVVAFAFSLLASATPVSWAVVETTAYTGDNSGGTATAGYAAYYCTLAKATELFGGTSVNTLETYIRSNYGAAQALATTYDSVGYSDGEYHIIDYVGALFESTDYVAYALYGDAEGFRVYGAGSAALTPDGQLAFNESYAAAGTVGDWHQAIPEPSSALLLLLGAAGVSLRRKLRSVRFPIDGTRGKLVK